MSHRLSSSRGFSLVELFISAGLVLLVLSLGFNLSQQIMQMQLNTGEVAQLQQRATLVFEDLRRDLVSASIGGISLHQERESVDLAVHSAQDVAQDGTLVWGDRAAVYRWTLRERVWRRGLWEDTGRKFLRALGPSRLELATLVSHRSEVKPGRVTIGMEQIQFGTELAANSLQFPLWCKVQLRTERGTVRRFKMSFAGRLPRP